MGEEGVLGLSPRRPAAVSPGRGNATGDGLDEPSVRMRKAANSLAGLQAADTAMDDFEREEPDLIRQLEQQRSRIALLRMQIRREAARPARRSPEDDLESNLLSRVRAFEDTLTRLHARLVEWRRRRDLQHREREALLRALAAPVRAAYERAVRSGRTPAIALLRDGACSVCHAPVTWPEVVKDTVFSCWQCQRLLTSPL
jgi:predicted  nucleic acid-binding Zn-ribbon protein